MKKVLHALIALGTIISPLAASQTTRQCESIAIYKESLGGPLNESRAVLDVIRNRSRAQHKNSCLIVKEAGQFSWANTKVHWHNKKALTLLNKVDSISPVLSGDYKYFNNVPLSWGKQTVKVGRQYFSK